MSRLDLLHGTLDLLVLRILETGPLHGYGIAKALEQRSDNLLVIQEGSLYPALYRMESRGWISAEWRKSETGRRAKFYALTAEGRRQLEQERDRWRRFQRVVGQILSEE